MARAGRRSMAAATILVAALLAPMITATPAAAAGRLQSTTTVTAAPASSTAGSPVTLVATVQVVRLPRLRITPPGRVAFTATNGTATAALGTVTLRLCVFTPCAAKLTTMSMPVGTTSVSASYSGNLLVRASSGTTPVTVTADSNPGRTASVTCFAGQSCDTGVLTGSSTTLRVVADPSAGSQTVTASLEHGGQLHCVFAGSPDGDNDSDDGVPFDGDLGTFSSTAPDSSKTISYTGTDAVGARMLEEYIEAGTLYAGCYGAPHPFQGYVGGVYTDAQFVPGDGLFEAQLSNCANNSGQRPCFTNIQGPGKADTYEVKTQPGDPKFIG